MTKLINLESYLECCQYAYQFNQSPTDFIPPSGDLPRSYKTFIQNHGDVTYLERPCSTHHSPPRLEIRSESLPYASIGIDLDQSGSKQLYIIPDTVDLFTLSTSNFLGYQESYLYRSAYHYWNHFSEVSQYNFTKSLVFLDLDSFGSDYFISVKPDDSPQRVPILNTQDKIEIKSTLNTTRIYDNICSAIAHQILEQHFPKLSQKSATVNHLAEHLKKQGIFQYLQRFTGQTTVPLIIEIFYHDQIFYKQVQLSFQDLADLVISRLNLEKFRTIANQHPDYQFALVSQYNLFPQLRSQLPELICLNPQTQDFPEVWRQKQEQDFPLFAIYLDKIEFQISLGGEPQWIQLSDQAHPISYEGKAEVLTGKIRRGEHSQETFQIPQGSPFAQLPIQVNGQDYCKNNVPQDYKIEVEDKERQQDTIIKIEFHLKPGSFPQLLVADLEDNTQLKTALTDRKPESFSYIPTERISQNRQDESIKQVQKLKKNSNFQKLCNDLEQLHTLLHSRQLHNSLPSSIVRLKEKLKKNDRRDKVEPLQYITPQSSEQEVQALVSLLSHSSASPITQQALRLIKEGYETGKQFPEDKRILLVNLFLILGKTYLFSQYLDPERLLSWEVINQIKGNKKGCLIQYLQCAARIATKPNLQEQYFALFDDYYNQETAQYLWGYARILLWYYDFQSKILKVNYRHHFTQIASYLLTKESRAFNSGYKQDAFLTLIYLLSFRAQDKSFCKLGSTELEMAQEVVNYFQDETIILNQVSTDTPLNQMFQDLVEGTATEFDVTILVQAN